jgi:hypothetical protein
LLGTLIDLKGSTVNRLNNEYFTQIQFIIYQLVNIQFIQ